MKFLTILCVTLLLISCGNIEQFVKLTTAEAGAIPEDFGTTESTILLVTEESKSYNEYLTKGFKENYFGPTKTVTASVVAKIDAESSKYKDIDAFRYIFWRIKTYDGQYYHSDWYFKDRKTNTTYEPKRGSSNFGLMIKAYAINLEKKRKENK